MADVILPGAAYTEKQGLYVNTEGRVQRAYQAAPPPGQAKEDRWVLMGIAKALGIKLPYKTFEELAAYLVEKNPLFKSEGLSPTPWVPFSSEIKEQLLEEAFLPAFSNFYMTDVISRHSKVMAACTQSREESQTTSQRIGSQKS